MEVSGSYFACRLIRSGIPRGSALWPVLFNTSVNQLNEATLIEFSGHRKLIILMAGLSSRGTWTDGKNKQVDTMVWSLS